MLNRFTNLTSEEHYLRQVSNNYDSYMEGLCGILDKLRNKINPNQLDELIDKKLQAELQNFNEAQYIQAACELSVMNDFIDQQDIEFLYENKVSPPKDVDFSIKKNNVQYNIEVKCPTYKHKVKESDDEVQLTFVNRTSTLEERNEIVEDISAKLNPHDKVIIEGKTLDNTLKDFLESTQDKVIESTLNDVNILVVCCNDSIDMHTWREYLFGFSGFFTENTFIDHDKFDRVDYVLLTNIYNRHYKFFDESLIRNHWYLSSSFNLLYPNKYSIRNQSVVGEEDLKVVNDIFPNHNISFEKYLKDCSDVPIGEVHTSKETIMGVAWFSDKFKKDGVRYFK